MKQAVDGNLLSPLPIILVGALVKGRPNFLVIGYSCPFDFAKYIFFSLYKKRYTRAGIHENKSFSVNIPSRELLAETKVCGSKSGKDFDKSTLFDIFYGELKTAPMISQCPITIECELYETLDHGEQSEGVVGRVVKSYVDSDCIIDGKLDMRKVDPIIWSIGGDNHYYELGDRISGLG